MQPPHPDSLLRGPLPRGTTRKGTRRAGRLTRLLATGLGAGHFPVAPGTVGSLWGLPLVWVLHRLPGGAGVQSLAAIVLFIAGVWICTRAAREFPAKDPRQIVYDEYTAFVVVFLFVPLTWTSAVAGFVWFRVFDIWKPWPIRRVERLPAGLGIMADDFVAALYACAALLLTMQVASILPI